MNKFKKQHTLITTVFFYVLLHTAWPAWSEVAVIVHPSNNVTLDKNIVKRIYLGKQKSFSDGNIAIPINLRANSEIRNNFNKEVLNKSSSQVKAYWSKLMFTGKGVPPKELENAQDVIAAVSENPGTIGYIDASLVTTTVKVIATY